MTSPTTLFALCAQILLKSGHLSQRLGLVAALSALTLTGSLAPAWAQASLDVDLSGQQEAPSAPPLPDNLNAIFVDASNGNDAGGNGSRTSPYRTITFAISRAPSGSLIQLLPGTYSEASGEVFPIEIPSGMVVRGDESRLGEGFFIAGGGTYVSPTVSRQSVAILPRGTAEIRGVTVRNEGRRGYAIWVESANPRIHNNSFVGNIHDGVFIAGQSAPWIEGNRFYQNGANGISILGTSTPTIVNNLFQETGFGITVDQRSSPIIRDNRILQNRAGVIVGGNSTPKLRGNFISRNLQSGLVAITLGHPDLGTAGDPGNNVFEGNGEFDVNNSTRGIQVAAFGNNFAGALNGQVSVAGQASAPAVATSAPGAVTPGSLSVPSTAAAAPPAQPVAAQPTESIPAAPVASEPPTETPVAQAPAPPVVPAQLPSVSIPATQSPALQPAPVQPAPIQAQQPPATNSADSEFQVVSFTPDGQTGSPSTTPVAQSGGSLTDITTLLPPPGQRGPASPTAPIAAAPPAQPTDPAPVAAADGAQFRVIVPSPQSGDLAQIQQLVPDAQETLFNGSTVVEAGLYASRSAAQSILDRLLDAGFAAIAEIVFP